MFFVFIGLIIAVYIIVMATRVLRYSVASRAAARVTQPYMRVFKDAREHLLVLGDSTMYGAGTKSPDHTVGGLLAAKYPKATVETLAVNGAKIKDLVSQLAQAQYEHYDLIVIGIGGNDIVQMSSISAVRHELNAFLDKATPCAQQVILCHSVNIGNIGFFLFPLNYLFDYRSRRLSNVYRDIAAHFPNVTYVNFYRPLHNDHYDKITRKNFIAEDAFHPNDYANQYFFELIWKELRKSKSNQSAKVDLQG